MTEGRVLGVDPGEKRVGVALSDPLGMIAQPFTVLAAGDEAVDAIRSMVAEFDVVTVVVGLPVSLSGEEGPSAAAARALAERLAEAVDVPVVLHDERFTSVQAEGALLEAGVRRAERRQTRDKVAAAVMLQSFLDRRESPPDDQSS